MTRNFWILKNALTLFLSAAILAAGCSDATPVPTSAPTSAPTATTQPTVAPAPTPELPKITSVEVDRPEVPRYESIEMTLTLEAEYTNPFDAREVSLDGVFTGPDGTQMTVPGFWDGQSAWKIRFTPSLEGAWTYQLTVKDARGESQPAEGTFNVIASDLHGWLQVGSVVNPAYSSRYLAHHDGTPFYGIGHGDALNILVDGFDADSGVALFDKMKEAGENYVVWWPFYSNSPINNSYDEYSAANMGVIDVVVKDAQKKGIFLIFTIWDHPELRDDTHAWGTGNWGRNGFSKLSDIDSFFTAAEPWAWQENFYRYVIARWGYSPAIGMWQTVSEINGTNSYEHTDSWHERVNAYFVEHDPYRHPTTASQSGDIDWPEGFAAMDAPQVHVYAFENEGSGNDAVQAADIIAGWTTTMWEQAEKPNWVGEFGVTGTQHYPELFHNSIWAALSAGAALMPAEWNGGGGWGRMTPEMNADMIRLGQFVADIPLVELNPVALQITSSDPEVRGWGVAGEGGGLFWVQDFALEGKTIDEVRADTTIRSGVELEVEGLAGGTYTITPYDTWQGIYLEAFEVTCSEGEVCVVALPEFKADIALKVERK